MTKNIETTAGFQGVERSDFYRDNIIGKWFTVATPQGANIGGFIESYVDGHLVLRPHIAPLGFDMEKGAILGLVEKSQYINVVHGMRYVETTREILEEYCAHENYESERKASERNVNGTAKK